MNKLKLLLTFVFISMKVMAQHPSNDLNYESTPYWKEDFDEANFILHPQWRTEPMWHLVDYFAPPNPKNPNKFAKSIPKASNLVLHIDAGTGDSILSIIGKTEWLPHQIGYYYDTLGVVHYGVSKDFNYSCGYMTTGSDSPHTNKNNSYGHYTIDLNRGVTFGYGYYEIKVRLPDDLHTATYGDGACWGNEWDFAFWLWEQSSWRQIEQVEIDFFEIMTGCGSGRGFGTNTFTCNMHCVKNPLGPGKNQKNNFTCEKLHSSDATEQAKFVNRYERRQIVFNGGWHTFGYEWLPNQLKYYIDGKLWFRLEGNYTWTDPDSTTFSPVHEHNFDLPMILGFDIPGGNPAISADPISMDIDYIHYFRLKKEPTCADLPPKCSNYNFCTQYNYSEHKVYENVKFGDTASTSCDVYVDGCRRSVRATNIKYEDGFKVKKTENTEFYTHDVKCDSIK